MIMIIFMPMIVGKILISPKKIKIRLHGGGKVFLLGFGVGRCVEIADWASRKEQRHKPRPGGI